MQAVDDLARALEPHRVPGHAGQVGGVAETLADDQHVRADLVNEVPGRVYMAARSVVRPLPQAGVRIRRPTLDRRGSFMMSIPATSGLDLYRAAMLLPGREEPPGRPAVVEPQALLVVVRAAPAGVERVAVGDDDQARIGERLDAGVVDLHRRGPGQVGVGGQVLVGDRSGLLGHPQAEREPHAVEPVHGDRLASVWRSARSRPGATPSSSCAPYQFTPASRTRRPCASTM